MEQVGFDMHLRTISLSAVAATILVSAVLVSTSQGWPQSDIAPYGSMIGTQLRHTKLWFAGKLSNWRLAAFELDQIDHDLTQATAMLSSNSPLRDSLSKPLGALRKAIDSKHTLEFADAYAALTNECNACHRATGHGFITVQVPASSSFPDQAFEDLCGGRQRLDAKNLRNVSRTSGYLDAYGFSLWSAEL